MNTYEVLVVGAAITDLQLRPVPDDVLAHELTSLDRFSLSIGGDAVNEATVISRLDHQVSLMSLVGNDAPGQYVLNHCRENHIDMEPFTISDELDTAINVGLISEAGVRSCITPTNSTLWQLGPEHLKYEYLDKGYKILSYASIYTYEKLDGKPLTDLFRRAKEKGMIVCADMNASNYINKDNLEDMKECLSHVDYFFPNYGEACWMTDETDPEKIADIFLSWGVKHIIVKTGAKGCLIKSATECHRLPAYTKVTCVDETGAGDNFASGFICGLLEGKSFLECAELATATASIAVEHVGAAVGVKTREQVDQRLKEYLEFLKETC